MQTKLFFFFGLVIAAVLFFAADTPIVRGAKTDGVVAQSVIYDSYYYSWGTGFTATEAYNWAYAYLRAYDNAQYFLDCRDILSTKYTKTGPLWRVDITAGCIKVKSA